MNQNEKKTNILAILGFVFSFLIAIVGLVLSILGLNKSKETGSGKGLSIAGIIISSISIFMSILIMILFVPYYFSYDNISNNIDNKESEDSITVNSNEEFVDAINKGYYNISYNDLKFIKNKNEDSDNFTYLDYSIYYKDNLLNISHNKYGNISAYLLSDGSNNSFALVSEITPVAASSRYSIIAFDKTGEILLDNVFIQNGTEMKIDNDTIEYSYETKMIEEELRLSIEEENNEDFCGYLKENYNDDNYVVSGSKKYKYINGNLELIEDSKLTINDYKKRNNCS